jgi:hypothetical protein
MAKKTTYLTEIKSILKILYLYGKNNNISYRNAKNTENLISIWQKKKNNISYRNINECCKSDIYLPLKYWRG